MIVPGLLISHGCDASLSIARAVSNATLLGVLADVVTGHQSFCAYSCNCYASLVLARVIEFRCKVSTIC